MQFLLHVTCSCIPHAYVLYFQYTFYIWNVLGLFWLSFSLLLFSFMLVVSMAPKRKSTLSQNPLRSRTLSSSDPTSFDFQFHNEDAWKDFSRKFSWQGVHSERRVILADFADTNLPDVIHSRGWESLCDILVTCPSMLIQEFYSNMYGFNYSVPLFHTRVQGMHIVVTPQLVADVLFVLKVEHPNYPRCERLRTMSKDKMISAFCKQPFDWGDR